jgi:predicted nucleic acid-binding protein
MIVVDSNLIGYLLLASPHSKLAEQVLQRDSDWIAPLLWRSEFRNVLALYMRQEIITLDESLRIMDTALELMAGEEYEVASHRVLRLANESGCSAYDCEFVALAKDVKVPLVTSDKKLLNAFPQDTISPSRFCAPEQK